MRRLGLIALLFGCLHPAALPPAPVQTAVLGVIDPAVQAALEAGAADLDVAVRRQAVAMLIRTDALPAGGAWGPRGRFDPSEYVRRAAIDALGDRAGEVESRAILLAILEDAACDRLTRGAAALALAGALGGSPVPEGEAATIHVAIERAALTGRGVDSLSLLLAATEAGDKRLGEKPAGETGAKSRLVALLAAGNLPMELWVLRALGESGEAELATPLAQSLEGVEPEIRLAVAAALLQLGHPAGAAALDSAISGGEDTGWEALEYLTDVPGEAAEPLLLAAQERGGPVLGTVATMVSFGHGEGGVRPVLEALAAEDRDVRLAAAIGAGRRLRREPGLDGGDRLRAALSRCLSDPDPDPALQFAALDALAGSAWPEDRAALTARLQDESVAVRTAAAVALATVFAR